jgi:hypothetical protein
MSLAPHERQALNRIESAMYQTDPVLATMLSTFKVPRSRRLRSTTWWRLDRLTATVLVVAAAFLLALGLALLTAPGSAHQPPCVTGSSHQPVRAGCDPGIGAPPRLPPVGK